MGWTTEEVADAGVQLRRTFDDAVRHALFFYGLRRFDQRLCVGASPPSTLPSLPTSIGPVSATPNLTVDPTRLPVPLGSCGPPSTLVIGGRAFKVYCLTGASRLLGLRLQGGESWYTARARLLGQEGFPITRCMAELPDDTAVWLSLDLAHLHGSREFLIFQRLFDECRGIGPTTTLGHVRRHLRRLHPVSVAEVHRRVYAFACSGALYSPLFASRADLLCCRDRRAGLDPLDHTIAPAHVPLDDLTRLLPGIPWRHSSHTTTTASAAGTAACRRRRALAAPKFSKWSRPRVPL